MLSPDDILLTDQVAIVTGGAQGIGEGIATNFARFGARVVIADKNAETGESTARAIRDSGADALFVKCDVRELDQVEQMVEAAQKAFGRIDILVNNAGGVRRAPFLELQERGWRKHIDLNLYGLFGPTDLAARAMIAGGRGGSIINVATIEAFRGAPHRSVYAACKAAMVNFTRTLSLELAEHGIRVNAIAPDIIATPGIRLVDADGGAPSKRLAALKQAVPLGRVGHTDEAAGACVFLASRMAAYVTGATLHVDGGTWASSGWTRDAQDRWQLFEGFADAY
jgi:NAD(P)-dependent dehydrogenase (short-subunit alcohol dehydrogenase family)